MQIKKSIEFANMVTSMPISIDCLGKIIDLWKFSRNKIIQNFVLICEELEEDDIERIADKNQKIKAKFKIDIPKNNKESLNLLFSLMESYEVNHIAFYEKNGLFDEKKTKERSEKIKTYKEEIWFYGIEIYDQILSKINISKESSDFGIITEVELGPGLQILNEKQKPGRA